MGGQSARVIRWHTHSAPLHHASMWPRTIYSLAQLVEQQPVWGDEPNHRRRVSQGRDMHRCGPAQHTA
eukprot:220345-Chlamydomonas_euryale.AAC.4